MPNWKNYTHSEVVRLVNKLSLETTGHNSKENRLWYVLDGIKLFKITFPNVHGGSKNVSIGFIKSMITDLKVNKEQWVGLVECPMKAEEYAEHIRQLKSEGKV